MMNFLAINRTYFKLTFINLIPLELLVISQHFLLIIRYDFVVHYIQQLLLLFKNRFHFIRSFVIHFLNLKDFSFTHFNLVYLHHYFNYVIHSLHFLLSLNVGVFKLGH
jgi:hypothetical protein